MAEVAERTSVFAAETAALPSGHTGLPRELVEASQRQRLVHGVTLAVAEDGYAGATITRIAARAGVSKKTFYEHFDGKLTCFLAAYDHGSTAILRHVAQASIDARAGGADAVDQLRAGTRAYLAFLTFEEPYARTFCLEMLAAGPAAVVRHRQCREAFAKTVQAWHAGNRGDHPNWPALPPFAFEAATGVVYEACSARIAAQRGDELLGLEDELVSTQLAILRVPPGPAGG